MRVTACWVAVVLATATVASAQTPPAARSGGVACSLLTKDDAAAALGEAVTGPSATSMPEASTCEYSASGNHKVQLSVMPLTAANSAMYKAMCAQKGKEGLTGLGDSTCWYNDKHGELQVMKGLTFFSIELRKNGDPTEAIKAVARKVYDRLK